MFGNEELARLEQRRRDLLLESEVQRRLLALEWAEVRVSAWWVEAGAGLVRKAQPALLLLAPLVGFWVVRKITGCGGGADGPSRFWERLATGLTLFQRARGLWEQFAKKPAE